ncbi:putative esterase [Solidesulfovibrio fructosivorans JJ]]|uniref:Putative esterase n=1 Tax=Solidesulfovibrio fructosivorans JJ] TaxID=596151 RepID=E1JYW0_SOLFR|nr:alpha/beta hydrolase family protein [Solidesulfovibrio fructosivorans]EFL50530.1 putative esterase [Solidesulfovibrio fructosivorans JJ]]
MATFVCVHGAFQGGWVWKRTAEALFPMGHRAYAPTLSGCGFHRHTMDKGLGLEAYVRDLTQFFEMEDLADVYLVAHSYSGIVGAGAMAAIMGRLSGTIYVEGIIPQPGKSFAGVGGEPFQAMLQSKLTDGWLVSPWEAGMFGVAGAPDEAWFMARVAPFPMAAFTDAAVGELVFPVKRHYVRCAKNPNPMFVAMADRAKFLGFAMHSIDSGHCPQITVPVELARVLATIVDKKNGEAKAQ